MSADGYIRRFIPACEGYGWTGGPGFETRIVRKLNGRERRNADMDQPEHSYSLPFQGLTQLQYAPIKRMHLNRRGAWGVFLYRDPLDDTAVDELLAIAAPGQTTFQLAKESDLDGVPYSRLIRALYEPDPAEPGGALESVIQITKDGAPFASFSVDYDSGQVITSPMVGGEVLRWSGRFALWVRFVSDKLPFTIINHGADGYFIEGSIDLLEQPPPVEISSTT